MNPGNANAIKETPPPVIARPARRPRPHDAGAGELPARSRSDLATPLGICCGLVAAVLAARLSQLAPFLIPPCGLRALTGIPCPLCGSTRSLIALSRLELAEALAFNPLVVAVCAGFVVWCACALIDRVVGSATAANLGQRARRLRWLAIGLAAVVANWVYLAVSLPR